MLKKVSFTLLTILLILPSINLKDGNKTKYLLTLEQGKVQERVINNYEGGKCLNLQKPTICGTSGKVSINNIESMGSEAFNEQWALTKLQYEDVSNLGHTGRGIVIAVIDTGVDSMHDDLKGVVLPGYNAISDTYGTSTDDNGHGTHVAGIIAAQKNNLGVIGLAPGVKILPIKALAANGDGEEKDVAKGVLWAIEQKVDIINLSLGGDQDNSLLRSAIEEAISAKITVVASSGNDGALFNKLTFPASLPGVIAVSATDPSDSVAYFSNTGEYVDIAAPGVFIKSTWTGGMYKQESGTSMAAPYVSASIALIASALKISSSKAAELALIGATDIESIGVDKKSGYGLVDPYGVITNTYPRSKNERPAVDAPNIPSLPQFKLQWPELPVLDLPKLKPYPLPKIKPFPKPDLSINPPSKTPDPKTGNGKPTTNPEPNEREYTKIVVKGSKSKDHYVYIITLKSENQPIPLKKIFIEESGNTTVISTNGRGQLVYRTKNKSKIWIYFKGDSIYAKSAFHINSKSWTQ